jgi:hypothetical protein
VQRFPAAAGISDAVLAEIDETVDEIMTNMIYELYRDATLNLCAYDGWARR